MTYLGLGIVSEGDLVTPDVNLVRYMGGPWSDQFTVLGCPEFRAKTNLMKQKKNHCTLSSSLLVHFVNISKNNLLHKDKSPLSYKYYLYQENGKKISYTK